MLAKNKKNKSKESTKVEMCCDNPECIATYLRKKGYGNKITNTKE